MKTDGQTDKWTDGARHNTLWPELAEGTKPTTIVTSSDNHQHTALTNFGGACIPVFLLRVLPICYNCLFLSNKVYPEWMC